MPTPSEIDTAATNFIADTDTADAKINGAAGTVVDRHGTTTDNLEKIFSNLGYAAPVAFTSGLSPSGGSFTVTYLGATYAANPSSIPFTTTASFDSSQWLLIISGTSQLGVARTDNLPLGPIDIPVTFNNTLGATIYWDGEKVQYDVSPYDLIDFTLYEAAINHYYVNYVDGDNANAGTSTGSGNSWKTLDYAIDNASSPAVIHLEDDWIGYLSSDSSTKPFSGKLKIIGEGSNGRTFIAPMRESYTKASFAWASSGANGAYVSTGAQAKQYRAMFNADYRDAKGLMRPLTDAGSQAACEASDGAGTFFYDTGTTYLYVHMHDGQEPDPNTGGEPKWVYCESAYDFEIQQALTTEAGVILLENLEFACHLGTASTQNGFRYRPVTTGAANGARFGAKNCLTHGTGGNGFQVYDADVCVMENCHTARNRVDGFNYHSFITTGTRGEFITVYEHNCSARLSGYDLWDDQTSLSTSANGSTAHDSMHIIRTNTIVGDTNGAVIADVNGVHSLNFNVKAGTPDNAGTASPKALFWHEKYRGYGATKLMYLWGCGGHDDGDSDVDLITNQAQAGGSANDGEVRVKYWRGQSDGGVTGSLKDFDGNDIS